MWKKSRGVNTSWRHCISAACSGRGVDRERERGAEEKDENLLSTALLLTLAYIYLLLIYCLCIYSISPPLFLSSPVSQWWVLGWAIHRMKEGEEEARGNWKNRWCEENMVWGGKRQAKRETEIERERERERDTVRERVKEFISTLVHNLYSSLRSCVCDFLYSQAYLSAQLSWQRKTVIFL